jgi:hypothetical protein
VSGSRSQIEQGGEDGELIAALRAMLDRFTGADRIRATVILERSTSLRRPLMTGWQAEAREIINKHRAETDALSEALGFGQITGGMI